METTTTDHEANAARLVLAALLQPAYAALVDSVGPSEPLAALNQAVRRLNDSERAAERPSHSRPGQRPWLSMTDTLTESCLAVGLSRGEPNSYAFRSTRSRVCALCHR